MPSKNNFRGEIALIVLGLGGCTALGWYVFRGTPRYSLRQLQTAIQNNDRALIQEYLDSEAISMQIVDTAIQTVQQQANIIPGDLFGNFGASIGRGIVKRMRPIMEQQVEQYLDRAIANTSQFEGSEIKLVTVKRVESDKAIATFDISQLPNSDKLETQLISVVLRQQESRRWKIVGLSKDTLAMFAQLATPKN